MLYFHLNQLLLSVFYMLLIELHVKMKNKKSWFKVLTNKWEQKYYITIILECEQIWLYFSKKVWYSGGVSVKWRFCMKLGRYNTRLNRGSPSTKGIWRHYKQSNPRKPQHWGMEVFDFGVLNHLMGIEYQKWAKDYRVKAGDYSTESIFNSTVRI